MEHDQHLEAVLQRLRADQSHLDMLPRAPLPETQEKSMEEEINYHVHQVISNFPATESKSERKLTMTSNSKI